ncbi:hypothetical protein DFJ43DRAFT_1008090, partial [Lentinula guzmanii]
YLQLVTRWIELERSTAWQSPRKGLTTDRRPEALSRWQRKRYVNPEPNLSTPQFVASFSEAFWQWWILLQPKWRAIGPGEKLNPPDFQSTMCESDWQPLDKRGINGWFGLMVCLKWWGQALIFRTVAEQVVLRNEWLRAIHDVSAMLDGLLAFRAAGNIIGTP